MLSDANSIGERAPVASNEPRPVSRPAVWASVLALVLTVFILYGRNLDDYFLGDDFELVRSFFDKPFGYFVKLLVYNESGDIWKHLGLDPETGGYLRPLKIWSLALDFELWGTDPVGFHLTSTALFAFAVVMVFLLARELIGDGWRDGAMLAAFLAAVHPVPAEIVPWISGRDEIIPAGLTVATVYAFVRHRTSGAGLGWVCLWLALALLGKESGVVSLLLLAGYDLSMLAVLRPPRVELWRRLRSYVPLGAVAVAYVALRVVAFGNPVGGFGGAEYGSPSAFLEHQQAFWSLLFHPSMLSFSSVPGIEIVPLALASVAALLIWRTRHLLDRRYFAHLLFAGPIWYLLGSVFYYGLYFSARHCVVLVFGLSLFAGLLAHGALVGLRPGWRRSGPVVALALLAGLALVPPGQQKSRKYDEAAGAVERVLDWIDRETANLVAPCTVRLVNAPISEAPPYYFGWGLQSALRPPFRESGIGERCRVFSDEDSIINGYARVRLPSYDRVLVINTRGSGDP